MSSTADEERVERCIGLAVQRWTFAEADTRTEVEVEVTLGPGAE